MSELYFKEVKDFDMYKKAKEMLLAGFEPSEIAKTLGVSIKELCNWFLTKKPIK